MLMAAAQTPAGTAQGPLTIDEAAAIAEQNAFATRISESNVEKNRQIVSENKGALGPKVTVNGTYTRFAKEISTQFSPTSPPIVIQPIDTKTLSATASIPIDIMGNMHRLVSASQATLRASQNTLLATRSDQRLAAKQAFLAVLRAQATVGVQNQALIDAQERLSQAQKELAAGTVAPVDEKRFEAQVAQAKSDLITAQNALDLAKQTFNQTLARPIETPVDLVEPAALPIVPSNVPGLVETGQKQRPEVRSLQATIESLADIRRATEAGMNPSLTFSLNNQRNLDATGFTASAETTTGVLALSIPIFDSGVTRDRVKAARQDELQAKIQLEQLELGISEEVRAAVTNLSSASSRLDNARQQVALAEEVYRLSKIRQDAGEGTYVEVIDAETQLTQARNSLVSARYDYLTAYSQLQRAIGSDDVGAAQAAGGK